MHDISDQSGYSHEEQRYYGIQTSVTRFQKQTIVSRENSRSYYCQHTEGAEGCIHTWQVMVGDLHPAHFPSLDEE